MLRPVQQERIGRRSDGVARLRAVINGDDSVFLHQILPAVAVLLRIRVQRKRQVAPVNQVVAYCMPPVNAVLRAAGSVLEEQVPAPLPETQPVRVIHHILRRREVVRWPIRVSRKPSPRLCERLQLRIRLQRAKLLVQRLRVSRS